MTHEEFLGLISKTSRKQIIGGIFILVFGLLLGAIMLTGVDNPKTGTKIFIYILGAICLLIGIVMLRKAIQTQSQLKNRQHPLVNAINSGDTSYVAWFYEHKVTANKVEATSAHQIWIYDRHNKFITISVKKSKVEELMGYLYQHFPAALVGYTDENKALYKQKVS